MRSVFEMPIDDLRDRADTVCEVCAELLEVLPLLAGDCGPDASDDDRAELDAACDNALSLVRSGLRRIGHLLPGLSTMAARDLASPAQGAAPRTRTDEERATMSRFLERHPASEIEGDCVPSSRALLLRRAHDSMVRREIFERVGGAVGGLLDELVRRRRGLEVRGGMSWRRPDESACN